jgi:histidinol-phosphate/aromatic aminotransferase/cobyric acid decarboxylase-like protein
VGNGASELLGLAAQAFLRPGEAALVIGPTYGEYRRAALLAGALVGEYWSPVAWDFVPSLDDVELLAAMQRTRVVFVCNPNNPTGVLLDRDAIDGLTSLPGRPLVVLDEAFMSLASAGWDSTPLLRRGNALIVRSMTKDHGVPGVRLGYALGSPESISAIQQVAPPWSVNAAAQAVGLVALADEEHVARGRQLVREVEAYLRRELAALGLTLRPSAANFWLVAVPDAAGLRAALLDFGIVVRDATSFGLPGHIRLGARPLDECARLVAALSRVLPA